MDFSKLKLEVYDLLGLLLPGLVLICEGWILFRGWHAFVEAINQITGTSFTLLLLVSFPTGNAVRELGDLIVKRIKGKPVSQSGPRHILAHPRSGTRTNKIKSELGQPATSADLAFDYCLTKVRDRFGKRDIFLATSDLCRSFVVLSLLALVPDVRFGIHDLRHSWATLVLFCLFALIFAFLMWKRMVRFRELSETTVFRVYLAIFNESNRPS